MSREKIALLRAMEVGDERFVSTTAATARHDQQAIVSSARHLKPHRFATALFTGVGAAGLGEIIYLIRVTRVEDES